MGSGMNVCAVFNFDGFGQALDQSPELPLDIVFCNGSFAIEDYIEWHLGYEVTLLEVVGFLLKLLEGVNSAFFEPEFPRSNQASGTMPVVVWY